MKRTMGALALAILSVSPAAAGMGSYLTSHYAPSEVGIVMRSGMPTVILGQAGDADAEDVLALLRLPGWLSDGSYVAASPATKAPRLVVLLNPTDHVAAKRDVCRDVSRLAFGDQGSRFILRAAFCSGDRIISRVTASEAPVTGADDPRLVAVLNRVTFSLFPGQTHFQVDPPGP